MKIVVTKTLGMLPDQKERLETLGDVTYHDNESKDVDEWFERVKNADIICTGISGLDGERVYELQDKFIALPFVGADFLDLERLSNLNIKVANAPGCNKEAVAEWVVGMLLMMFRNLNQTTKPKKMSREDILETGKSIWNKNITILGAGNIGNHLNNILSSFGANISVYKRGDNLHNSVETADIVINCLGANDSTVQLLNRDFFEHMKKGAYFISVARPQIYDIDALLDMLDNEHLAGAIDDAAGAKVGDISDEIYQKLYNHPRVVITPHIAWNTESETRKSNDIMIDHIAAWIKDEPENILN